MHSTLDSEGRREIPMARFICMTTTIVVLASLFVPAALAGKVP